MKKLSIILFGLLLIAAAYCQPKHEERIPENCSALTISSNISPLRAFDSSWEKGDKIGVFAAPASQPLTSAIHSNVIYYTANGDGNFDTQSKILIAKNQQLDITAYYPHSSAVKDNTLPIDVSDQSNPAAIDILYAKSNSPATFNNRHVALTFDHMLSQLVVTVVAEDGTEIKDIKSTLDGLVVKGSMDLASGKIAPGAFESALSGKTITSNGGTASLSYLLLPDQSLEGKSIRFAINGKNYKHTFSAQKGITMQGGWRYTFPFVIKQAAEPGKPGEVVLIVDGAIIDPMVDDPEETEIIIHEDGTQEEVSETVITDEINISYDASGAANLTKTFSIDAASNETWTAVADKTFVNLRQSTTNGSGQLTITLEENLTYEERTATVIVTIVPQNNTSSGASVIKKIIYHITQAPKKKPAAEANLLLLDAQFQNGLNGFEAKSINGTAVWHQSTHNNVPFAKISGFDSQAKRAFANEDWLVSPAFDLTEATIAKLTFSHAINYANNIQEEAKLYYTTNYNGDIKSAQWIEVKIPNYPSGRDWTFVQSGEIQFPQEVLGKPNVRFAFRYSSTNSAAATWEINNLQVKANAGKQVGGTTPTPDPHPITPDDPVVPGGVRSHYMEIPYVKDGKMTDAFYVMHTSPDRDFAGGSTTGGKRRNYSIMMSKNSLIPYWVAYPLYPDCFGGSGRTDAWGWDPDMPNEYQPNLSSAYKGTPKQSRGHMLASSARTATASLNRTTFYYSNMIPQIQEHNGGNWQSVENIEQNWGKKNDNDTIYVVTGPIFDPNTSNTCTDNSGRRIPIPTHSWKVMLRKDRNTNKYYTLAVRIPNSSVKSDWRQHVTTVAELERELGVVFFTHLPENVAAEVKSQKDPNRW